MCVPPYGSPVCVAVACQCRPGAHCRHPCRQDGRTVLAVSNGVCVLVRISHVHRSRLHLSTCAHAGHRYRRDGQTVRTSPGTPFLPFFWPLPASVQRLTLPGNHDEKHAGSGRDNRGGSRRRRTRRAWISAVIGGQGDSRPPGRHRAHHARVLVPPCAPAHHSKPGRPRIHRRPDCAGPASRPAARPVPDRRGCRAQRLGKPG